VTRISENSLQARLAAIVLPLLPEGANASEVTSSIVLAKPGTPADFSVPLFRLAKLAGRPPAEFAAEIVSKVQALNDPLIEATTATGGFVNFRLSAPAAAALVLPSWLADRAPEPGSASETVMVEYSQPNTHKAFHVGHMRNVAIGDSLVRVLRAVGHQVIAANYLGDVGTHVACCLWAYLDLLSDADRVAPDTGRGEWLGKVYVLGRERLDVLEAEAKASGDSTALQAAKDRIGFILQSIEKQEAWWIALWSETRGWSIDEFNEVYRWLGIHFDHVFYESEVVEPALALVDEYLKRGVFVEDQGAIGIANPEIPHMPFLLLRKRDGTTLYATKDLALAEVKFREFKVERSIYVVDVRQSDHFKQVFLTLKKMGFASAERCEHVPYEMVELPSGAMSSRKGTVVLFRTLRDAMNTALDSPKYLGRHKEAWDSAEYEETKQKLAVGAIKYGMLNRDLTQKIVFDLEEWLNPEGNTGAYLQYAAARAASILAKAKERGFEMAESALAQPEVFAQPAEKALLFQIAELPVAASRVAEQLRPSLLCNQLYALAKAYNGFQNSKECGVLTAEEPLRSSRLALVLAARRSLTWGLSLLGIATPQRI